MEYDLLNTLFTIDISNLLWSNDPPSDVETLAINTAIQNAQHRLSIIDRTDVTRDGDPLVDQQASESHRLQSFIKSARVILSPVHRVPSEVLGSIMEFSTYDVNSDLANGPLRFTHVSQLWRRTAIGLPSLWTNIQVNISTNRTNPGLADLIKEILARSHKLPLSVTLSLSGSSQASVHILDLLVAESYRWACFSVTLQHYSHFVMLLPIIRYTPGPLLESNHVISLSLQMFHGGKTFRLHLPNLLRLETFNTILAIRGNFPELRELFLHEHIHWRESHIIRILSTSTKLKYLTLSEWGNITSFYSEHLFRVLNATPSLEVLRLYPRGWPDNQNEDAIFSLIARLTLSHINTPNQTSFPVLPNLTHILLHLPEQLAYSVRLISSSEMKSGIKSRASELAVQVSPDFGNSRLRRIWIQDGGCHPGASKKAILLDERNQRIVDGVEVCIARPLVPALGWEVGLVVLSSSGEITSVPVLRNYM